jgi:hypothetical protein
MNDSTEFGLAVELAKKRMEARVLNTLILEPVEPLPWIIEKLEHIIQVNICSVSFCRHADLLSQWRGYSSGVGYAIVFRSLALAETARNQGCRLGRCIYEHSAQIGIIDELIDQITHQYASHSDVHPFVLKNTLSEAFASAVIEFRAFSSKMPHSLKKMNGDWSPMLSLIEIIILAFVWEHLCPYHITV